MAEQPLASRWRGRILLIPGVTCLAVLG